MKEKNIGFLFPENTTDKSLIHIFYMDNACQATNGFEKIYHSLCGDVYPIANGVIMINKIFDLSDETGISTKLEEIVEAQNTVCQSCLDNLLLLIYLKQHRNNDRMNKVYEEICNIEKEMQYIGKEKGIECSEYQSLKEKVRELTCEATKILKEDVEIHLAGAVSEYVKKLKSSKQ